MVKLETCSALPSGKSEVQDRQQRQDARDDQHAGPDGGREQRGAGRRDDHQSALRPFRANSPWGRFWMNSTITTRMAIFASTAPA